MLTRIPLYTIGYEGADVAGLVAALRQAGVATVIDVRAVPMSRKKGFSKNQLAHALEAAGIAYVGLTGLGTPKAGRTAVRSGDLETFTAIFEKHMATDAAQRDLAHAVALAQETPCCLLCYEAHPLHCHRSIVAERIVERSGQPVRHLHPSAPSAAGESAVDSLAGSPYVPRS